MRCQSSVAVFAIWALALGVAGCAGANPRSEGRYCTEVGNNLSVLNNPAITTGADITATLKTWRIVAGAAPIAIQVEWDTMVIALATASTVNPDDAASMQKVADTARASEPAANRVIDYTFQKCHATIGNVTPVTATTVAPGTAPLTPIVTVTTGG